jgi:hypothetical protein
LRCQKLSSEEAIISVSGGGSAALNVRKKMTAKVSGAGRIVYSGSPIVLKEIRGAGSIKKANY